MLILQYDNDLGAGTIADAFENLEIVFVVQHIPVLYLFQNYDHYHFMIKGSWNKVGVGTFFK